VVVRLPDAGGYYEVELENPGGRAATVVGAEVDGAPAEVVGGAVRVALVRDGKRRRVRVRLG
jgi:hypothetical protein